jgi:ATP-dependent helicase/nuclease subunit A
VKAYLEQHLPPEFTPLHPTMLTQVMQVLGHPTFAPLFGSGSLAEAPITGCLEDGTVVSGRIDRLLVTPDEVLVVDFKTGKAPTDTTLIPAAYAKQMELYAKLLRSIYPQHRIRTALLYVSEPVLIPLEIT